MKRSSSFSLDKRSFNLRLVERFRSEQLSSFQSEPERVMRDGKPTARRTDETKNKQQVMFSLRASEGFSLTSSGTPGSDHSPADATTLRVALWTRSNPEPTTRIILPPLKYTHNHNTIYIYIYTHNHNMMILYTKLHCGRAAVYTNCILKLK